MSDQENFPETVEQFIEEIDKTFDTDGSDSAVTYARILEGFKKYDAEEKNAELLWRASKAAYKVNKSDSLFVRAIRSLTSHTN